MVAINRLACHGLAAALYGRFRSAATILVDLKPRQAPTVAWYCR
jgi:hypothetical protein